MGALENKKLKIGYVLSYFHPFTDGTENNCLYLAREMVKLGHEVHVFTSDRREGKIIEQKEETYQSIHIHRSPTWLRYKYYLELNPGVIRNIVKSNLDVLHIHSFGFMMYDMAFILKKALGHKTAIINTPHGPFMSLDSYPAWQKGLRFIFNKVEKPINSLYDGVIQVNTTQWPWIMQHGIKRKDIHFVPDGIPKERFKEVPGYKEFLKKHKLEGKFILCNLSRVLEYKSQHHIIEALPAIIKKHPNVVFLQMGKDHGWTEHCKKRAKELGVQEHVRFLGMVSEEDKIHGLDAADIFLLPSEWEAFGIVTLEAMARRTAAVCSNCEGSNFLVQPENGLLHEWGDIKGLQTAVLTLIEDDGLRKQMEETNYKKAVALTNESIAKAYLEPLYYKLWLRKQR